MNYLTKIILFISLLIGIFGILGFYILKFFPILTRDVSYLIPFFIKFGAIGFTLSTIVCSFIISISCFGFFRTLLLFSISFITSLTMELSSTYNGFPFGNYKYTDFLGYKILNEVPVIIPLSWFSIVSLSYLMAKRLLFNGFSLVIASTLFGFFWDLSLDFAMTKTYPFWYWIDKGFLYDMPIKNWG
ncbi:MAG: carotenoid biosynthesis protein, partial [candidate division WOR-3 bacterium]